MNRRLVWAGTLASLTLAANSAAGQSMPSPPPKLVYDYRTQIPAAPPPATVKPGFAFAAAGDMIYSLPVLPRKDPGVEALARLVRAADAAMANQEGSIFDLQEFKGHLEAENGGGYPLGRPELARDIAGLGFDFANKANNHAVDFGQEGLLESRRNLQAAGLRTPGVGLNRALARAGQILDTPKGRVAVVGAASTFPDSAPAGASGGVTGGRPGISVLRTQRVALVTPSDMASLRSVAAGFGEPVSPDARELTLGSQLFRMSDRRGFAYDMDDVDRFEILRAVRGAKNVADVAVFTVHAHENAGLGDDRIPADFQQALYHDVIDAGGDIVAVHGPHVTRGVEIYRGKPIFYGLGHFVFQMLGSAPTTPEMAEESQTDPRFVAAGDDDAEPYDSAEYAGILAVTEFGDGGKVKEIRLYPIDLREAAPMKTRGIPQLATGARAREILEQVRKDSIVYRTTIVIEKDIGVIRLGG